MSRGLVIGGSLLLGGGALAYALSRADVRAAAAAASASLMATVTPLYEAEVEGVKQVVAAAKKGVIKVTDAAQVVWSRLKLPSEAQQNIVKHGLGELVDKYRGPIPKWMVLAIIHTETGGTFDPGIYNYRDGGKYKVGYWRLGAPLPTNSWANGLFQILRKFTRDHVPKGTTGYDIDFKDVFDPEKNIYAGLKMLKYNWEKRVPAQASDADKLALLYFSHNQGGPTLGVGLAKTKNKLSARDVITAAGAGMAGAPLTVALATATRGGLWAQLGDLREALA